MSGLGALASHVRRALASPPLTTGAVLGLDVSTKAIGMGVIAGGGGELVHTEVLTATGEETAFTVGAAVSERVAELHGQYRFQHVVVEDAMKSFAAGRFHAQGLFKLSRLNGVVTFECWRRTGATVACVMPNALRTYFAIKEWAAAVGGAGSTSTPVTGNDVKRPTPSTDGVKMGVLAHVTAVFPDLADTWATTRTGRLAPTNFDRADGILAAMYAYCQSVEHHTLLPHDAVSDLLSRYIHAVVAGAGGRRANALVHAARGACTADGGVRPSIMASLLQVHDSHMSATAKAWGADAPVDQSRGQGKAEGDGEEQPSASKSRRKRSAAVVDGVVGGGDAAMVEVLYHHFRQATTAGVRTLLTGLHNDDGDTGPVGSVADGLLLPHWHVHPRQYRPLPVHAAPTAMLQGKT